MLLFHGNNKKNGCIYKSTCESVTVTIYKSTNTLLIQGSCAFEWYSNEFLNEMKSQPDMHNLTEDANYSDTECKLVIQQPSPYFASTPKPTYKSGKNEKLAMDSYCDQCSSAETIKQLSEMVATLTQEVENLKKQLLPKYSTFPNHLSQSKH